MFKDIKNKVKDLESNDIDCKSEIESIKQDVKELERRVYINENPFKVELHTKVYGIKGKEHGSPWGDWTYACPKGCEGEGYVIELQRIDNEYGNPRPKYLVYMIGNSLYRCSYDELILEKPEER